MPDEELADEVTEALAAAALEPKEVTVDGATVVAHSLKDQIEAARFLRGGVALTRPNRGVIITKLVPGGPNE